ncbi:antibiotic biosynthesis monooxygenase family protein [Actinokineospora enzanensis]|uniref:antibiotic biosynthesis monooxygenase family protein n=1 Tax=Actinokineospora enzanensis TaxID=155975 RepID=UPI0003A87F27|nr:antibiotic biosynthesis monooxygenase family protein [Actinokineospora enzanensis]
MRALLWYRATGDEVQNLERAYREIGAGLVDVPGLRGNELLRSVSAPGEFVVASEWESLVAFRAWADDPAHRAHTGKLDGYRHLDRPAGRYELYEIAGTATGRGHTDRADREAPL